MRHVVYPLLVLLGWLACNQPARADETPATPQHPAARSGTTPERGFASGADVSDTLREIRKSREGRFDLGVSRFVGRIEDRIYRKTPIRFAAAYTMVYQHASDGSGPRDALGSDFDLIARWDAIGRKACNQSALEVRFESRYKIATRIAPSGLSTTIDSLWPTVSGFGRQDLSLTQVYWKQDFLGDRLQVRLGKVSASATFFGNRLNDASLFFFNFAFSDSPEVFLPGNGLGLHARYRVNKCWTVVAGMQNANGVKTEIDPSSIEKGEFWYAGQIEYRRKIRGLGFGTWRLAGWHSDAREGVSGAGAGTVLSIDQELSKKAVAFLRYGFQGSGLISEIVEIQSLTGTEQALRIGCGFQGPIPAWSDDYAGVALGWGRPSNSLARDSYVGEVFYRSQLTDTSHVSLSVQFIRSSTVFEAVTVFSVRWRAEF